MQKSLKKQSTRYLNERIKNTNPSLRNHDSGNGFRFTQAMIDMRNGGISASEGLAMAGMVDAMSKRMQVRLNAVKLQLQCKQMGEDFGKLIKNAKMLVEEGYDEQPEA